MKAIFKANLYTWLVHGGIGLFILLLFIPMQRLSIMQSSSLFKAYNIGLSILAACLYFYCGTKIPSQHSKWKNILSVSLITVVSLVVFGDAFFLTQNGQGSGIEWMLYSQYNVSFFPVMSQFRTDQTYELLLFSFLPSFLLWLGLDFQDWLTIEKNKQSTSFSEEKSAD